MFGFNQGVVISLDQETKEMVYTLEDDRIIDKKYVRSEMGKALSEKGEFRVKLDDAEYTQRKNILKLHTIYQVLLSSRSVLEKIKRMKEYIEDNKNLFENKNKYWMIALEIANGANFYYFGHKGVFSGVMNIINSLFSESLENPHDTPPQKDQEELWLSLDEDFRDFATKVVTGTHLFNVLDGAVPLGVDEYIQNYGISDPKNLHLRFSYETGSKIPFEKILFEEQMDVIKSECWDTVRAMKSSKFDLKQLVGLLSEKEYKSLFVIVDELITSYYSIKKDITDNDDNNIFGKLYEVFDYLHNLEDVKEEQFAESFFSVEKDMIEFSSYLIEKYMIMLKDIFKEPQ